MERRRFALSWGRKIFFGLGWPLLCLLSLVFLKSGVIPKDPSSVVYFILTTIGYYGVLTSILYFLGFVPVALIFPTYYFVRLWSAFLILLGAAAILMDGLVFSEYRFHINKLIVEIFSTKGPGEIFSGSTSPYVVTAGVVVFLFFVLWIRGEWLWRVMQRRFSNPVKNWYFALIILCMGLSHLLWQNQRTAFYGNEITLASLFPVNYQEIIFPKVHAREASSLDRLNYPKKDLKCKPKVLPTIIYIVLENFRSQSVNAEETPFIIHLQQHGMNFSQHLSGGGSSEDNLFRLVYGIPASYRPEAHNPVMMSELQKAGYELTVFSDKRIPGLPYKQVDWATWESAYKSKDPSIPQFLFFDLSAATSAELDLRLKETFGKITDAKLLPGSAIVITGTQGSEWETVPMTMILPDRTKGNWEHRTTHYDLAPTVLSKIFNCKTPFTAYSYGKALTDSPSRDWEIFGNENIFRIVDFTNRHIIESDWHGRFNAGGSERTDLVLKASREISRFYR